MRRSLAEALRREFAGNEPEPLNPLEAGLGRAIENRGITTVPGATPPPAKPWRRHVIDTLLEDKQATEQSAARREAQRNAPPPAPTTAELVKRALKAEVEKLNQAEADGADPAPTPALNSAQLLRLAIGQGNTGRVGESQW